MADGRTRNSGRMKEMNRKRFKFEEKKKRFLEKIGPPDKNGCMKYIGKFNSNGYGKAQFFVKETGATYYGAHRVTFLLMNGIRSIPKNKKVCHSCDNRWCVNPDHLWIGTSKENSEDMVEKGRTNHPWTGRKHTKETKVKISESRKIMFRERRAQC